MSWKTTSYYPVSCRDVKETQAQGSGGLLKAIVNSQYTGPDSQEGTFHVFLHPAAEIKWDLLQWGPAAVMVPGQKRDIHSTSIYGWGNGKRIVSGTSSWNRNAERPLSQVSKSVCSAITKCHTPGDLKTTEINSSHFWRLEVPDRGTSRFGVLWQPGSCREGTSLCPHWWKVSEGALWDLYYKGTNPVQEGSPHDRLTSQRPHLPIPAHWDYGFDIRIWGAGTFSLRH